MTNGGILEASILLRELSVDKAIVKAKSHIGRGEIQQAHNLYTAILRRFPNNKTVRKELAALDAYNQSLSKLTPPKEIIDRLVALYNEGDLSTVFDEAMVLTQQYPDALVIWNLMGASAGQIGRHDQAILAFKKVINIQPDYAAVHNNLGTALKSQGKFVEAEASYKRALQISPNYAEAYNNLGLTLAQQGKFEEALEAYGAAKEMKPDYAEAFYNLGTVLQLTERFDDALEAYNQALLLKPNFPEAYNNLGVVKKAQSKFEEALDAYSAALSINPLYAEAHNNVGATLMKLGEYKNAVEAFTEALSVNPSYFEAYYNLGTAYIEQGNLKEAIDAFQSALEINPGYAEAHNNLGAAYKEQGNLEEAIASYNTAITIKPGYAEAHNNLGAAYKEQGNLEEAIDAFQSALEINPEYAEAHNNLGAVFSEQSRYEEAIASYNAAITIKPQYAMAYYNLGVAQMELRRFTEAVNAFSNAVLFEENFVEAYYNLGISLVGLCELEKAVNAYQKSIHLNSKHVKARHNLGRVYWLQKEFSRAFELMEWRWLGESEFIGQPFKSEKPTWDGGEGAAVFVWREQGIGDEIMFSSMLSELNNKSKKLIVECDRRLVPLYERSFPEDIKFLSDRSKIRDEDYGSHIAIGSLPKHLRHSVNDFTIVSSGWLKADVEKTNLFRTKLKLDPSERVIGISWYTSRSQADSNTRNIPLELLAEYLKQVPATYINLQYGDTSDELMRVSKATGLDILNLEEIDNFGDIDGLAALISICNVVVSIDNSTVHLSGALGVDTKVLLPLSPDERWGLEDSDSYWYDHLALYRQEVAGNWSAPLERLIGDLNR